ncbi:MAG TPA: hypothetical protein VFN61_00295, partial [Acidimicrobiales bacterium]|nr:hypothetical protein [Acidimicrobiales bacterium]
MGFYSRARLEAMSPDEQQQLVATHINLGYHPVTGDEFLVPTLDLHSGFTINGVQGSGKSALVQYIVYQLVQQGYAVAVADPHLDTIDDCIAQLPDWALQKTFVLDLTDVDWPFAANVLALGQLVTPEERTAAVDRIVHIFELLWPETGSQVGLPRYLRNAVLALLDTPNTTLVDMYDLLTDEVVRARIVARVTDPTVRSFWRRFSLLKPTRQDTLVGPLVARLEALFAGRPIVRNIVGQRANSVDWRKVIDERQIVLIKLP